MPGWKFVIGGGEKIKNQEPQNNQNSPQNSNFRSDSNGSGGGNSGAMNNNGVQGGGSMNNAPYNRGGRTQNALPFYPQQEHRRPLMESDRSPMAMGAFSMGYYDGGGNMNGGYGPQNAQMGYIIDEPQDRRGGRRATGAEEEYYEPEARRGRSRRTGRFVHRAEGDDEIEARSRGRDDEDEGRDERSGSYSRREREDDGGEVEHLHKKIKKLEKRLEEGEEAQEHIRHLKKEVKHLKEALEEMKEEKGKEGGEDREKREKKKKERGKDDDDDDPVAGLRKLLKEGVSGKDFLKHLPHIFREVFEVIAEPPPTWPSYLEKGDYSGIYTMEAKELMKAIEQYKAGQKGVGDVMREIKHTGAALIQLYANLIQQLEEKK